MNLFYKRPLLLAMSCFLVLCVFLAFVTPPVRFWCAIIFGIASLLIAILAVFLFVRKYKHTHVAISIFLCALLCCFASLSSHTFFNKKLAALESTTVPVRIVAEVRECTFRASYTETYVVAVLSVDNHKTSFKAVFNINEPVGLEIGNLLEADVTFSPFEGMRNGYNERGNQIANGVLIHAEALNVNVAAESSRSVWSCFARIRKAISLRITQSDAQSAPLLKALLLGDKEDLNGSVALHFRRLGISHILSISGTHFTILLGMALFLLSAFRVNKRVSYCLMIPLALFYMALTAFSPSVCRSGIMAMFAYVGLLSGRMRDSYTALFAAVTAILLLQPYTVYSIGLWLSFAATFAILILLDVFKILEKAAKSAWWKKLLYYVFTRLAITIFVSFATLPIVALTFGEISLFAPIGNLLVVPLLECFLFLAPFTVLFASFSPLVFLSDSLYAFIFRLVDYLCKTDDLLISLRPPLVPHIAVVGCIATLILLVYPLKKKGLLLLPSGISLALVAVYLTVFMHQHASITDVSYFTYKENDGIVITDRNRSLLVDISDGSASPAYTGAYIAEKNYCPELAGILFTHYHSKHVTTLRKLSESVNIHAIYLPITDYPDAQNHMYSIEEFAIEQGIPVIHVTYGKSFTFAGSTITVYAPQYLSRSTHPVVSLRITAKETDVLYLGSSFNDTKLDLTAEVSEAEYIVYGQHHPKVKNPYSVETNAYPIYGDSDRFVFSENKRAGYVMDGDGDIYVLPMK